MELAVYNQGRISSPSSATIQFVHEKEETHEYWAVEYSKKGEGIATVETNGFSWMGFTDANTTKNALVVPVTMAGFVSVAPQGEAVATDLKATVELDLVVVS